MNIDCWKSLMWHVSLQNYSTSNLNPCTRAAIVTSLFVVALTGIRTGRILRQKADCKQSRLDTAVHFHSHQPARRIASKPTIRRIQAVCDTCTRQWNQSTVPCESDQNNVQIMVLLALKLILQLPVREREVHLQRLAFTSRAMNVKYNRIPLLYTYFHAEISVWIFMFFAHIFIISSSSFLGIFLSFPLEGAAPALERSFRNCICWGFNWAFGFCIV